MVQSKDCAAQGVVQIPLSQGLFAMVDEVDADAVLARRWYAVRAGKTHYAMSARRDGEDKHLSLHRFILPATKGLVVDHIDGNGLNNARSNLRLCTHKQNIRSQRAQGRGRSRFKGVSFGRASWMAYIQHDGETLHLGSYKDEMTAARQYDRAARLLFGRFAKTNEALGLFDSRA